jgi:hypothetical protein
MPEDYRMSLWPPGDPGGLRARPLPPEIRELADHCGGFDLLDEFGWDPECGSAVLEGVFSSGVAVGVWSDGTGGGAVIDVHPQSGRWGAVVHLDHDPPRMVVLGRDLGEWLVILFDRCRRALRSPEGSPAREAWEDTCWGDAPLLREIRPVPAEVVRASTTDVELARFAAGLPPDAVVCDLRDARAGDWVDLGTMSHDPVHEDRPYDVGVRMGDELVFAYRAEGSPTG